ncbi:MAG: NAD(P)H-hydrate dehydratase [Nitrospira sp.]
MSVAIPSSVNDVLEAKLLEAMTVPMPETKARTLARTALDRLGAFMAARTAVAIGPGLSTHPETVELIQALMKQLDRPAVLDADALNALTGRTALLASCKIPPIITPHPGEMARLEADVNTSDRQRRSNRYGHPFRAGAGTVRGVERSSDGGRTTGWSRCDLPYG